MYASTMTPGAGSAWGFGWVAWLQDSRSTAPAVRHACGMHARHRAPVQDQPMAAKLPDG